MLTDPYALLGAQDPASPTPSTLPESAVAAVQETTIDPDVRKTKEIEDPPECRLFVPQHLFVCHPKSIDRTLFAQAVPRHVKIDEPRYCELDDHVEQLPIAQVLGRSILPKERIADFP